MHYKHLIKTIYRKWRDNKASKNEIYFFAGFLGISGYSVQNPTEITKRMIYTKMCNV